MQTPYFLRKQPTRAEIVIHDRYPGQRMMFAAWRSRHNWWHRVDCPPFERVDLEAFRHLEKAFEMMIEHVRETLQPNARVGGGADVDVDWATEKNIAVMRVFPGSDKYFITLEREDDKIRITSPRMIFVNDVPGLNQARHACGQVVQVATTMSGE